MASNATMIEMHLDQYLRETNQYGELFWDAVMAYCTGYYDEKITMDHIVAIRNLERIGAIRTK